MRRSPQSQSGAAVIAAMLVVALAATTATYALHRQDLALRQLEAARDYEQARWILAGGTHWARAILTEDARSSATDHARELWASGLKATEIEEATLTGSLHDEQGLFNLANLLLDGKPSERDVAVLRRLLAAIGERATLAEPIAAALPMTEWAELHRIPGFDERTVRRLAGVATLLPGRTPINVNTAPPQVLAALVDGLEVAEAEILAQALRAEPAKDANDFIARLPRRGLDAHASLVAVSSGFFKVRGRVMLRKADVRLEALVRRQGTASPQILWVWTS